MQSGGTEMRRSEWVAVRAKRCKLQTKRETGVGTKTQTRKGGLE